MTLTAIEFLRRFCQHVLPEASSASATSVISPALTVRLPSRSLASSLPASLDQVHNLTNSPLAIWRCPRCGANMNIGPNLTAQQLAFQCPDTS
jgi:hypothetical protein